MDAGLKPQLPSRSPVGPAMSSVPEGASGSEATEIRRPAAGDVFVRTGDSDAREVAATLSGLSVALRGISFADGQSSHVIPLEAGRLTVSSGSAISPPSGREVQRVDLHLSNGSYAADISVDQDGGLKIRKLYKDGRSVTSIARDALKREIEADPVLWGSLTALAAAGVVVAAHEVAKRSGDPVRFEVFDKSVMRQGPWDLRVQAHAELTGTDRFIRPSGVGTALAYDEGRLKASLGVEYRPDRNWEANARASYALDKDVDLHFDASAGPNDHRVGLTLEARF